MPFYLLFQLFFCGLIGLNIYILKKLFPIDRSEGKKIKPRKI
jgi:hypothetical protein